MLGVAATFINAISSPSFSPNAEELSMLELAQLRGSHHCIGTGRAVADVIFKLLHSQAIKNGGALSTEEILSLKAQFNLNLPSGMAFFEKINQECMSASRSAAPDPLSRKNILQTLLSVCAKGSAEHAFRLQIEKCKAIWLNYFFKGLSQVVRKNINEESWRVLIAAYVQTAEMKKAKTQVMDVLARHDVKATIADGLAPLFKMLESEEVAKSTSAEINNVIVREYNLTGPSIVKITDDELKTFLTMLQEEMPIRLRIAVLGHQKQSTS
jgi:hypothetical protein